MALEAREASLPSLGPSVSWESIKEGARGFCEVHPARRVHGLSRYAISAKLEDPRLTVLQGFFSDPSYLSAALGFARLSDVLVDCEYGLCMTSDRRVIAETAHTPKLIEGALAAIPFLAGDETSFARERIDFPVLHCFHRSTAAYGYFIFDALTALALCRGLIAAGKLKLLLPTFLPGWIDAVLARIGIHKEYIVRNSGPAALCSDVLIPTLMDSRNTFRPNPDGCLLAAKLGEAHMGDLSARDSHIYISRRNQHAHNDRLLENEREVEQLLAARGYAIVKPGKLSFAMQAAIFRHARVIVGQHGSAFGNLIFARPGTKVIDLMPLDWIGFRDRIGTRERWLLNVATAMQLDYTVAVCPSYLVDDPARIQHGKRPIVYSAPLDLLSDLAPRAGIIQRVRSAVTRWDRKQKGPISAQPGRGAY